MMGKVTLAFLSLSITTLFLDTFANIISADQPGKKSIMNYGKCIIKCRSSDIDPVCAVLDSGRLVNLGKESHACLRKTCGRGGKIKHPGVCDENDYLTENASPNPALVGPNVGKTPQMTLQDHLNSGHA